MKEIELLAPAKNYEYGIAAINCGADAVYIGAPCFGARQSAGNPVKDIEALAAYAHLFGARVYVTMNTLLFDDELKEAEKLVWELWEAGADALIVQDMAYCRMNLPPIVLHASTQTANFTPERVKFLEEAGFQRVILERALSARQIQAIRETTGVELECFVHGAICVSYSGQCYLSHIVAGRSGNRGVCAQPCRSAFNLYDGQGNLLLRDKHLLSVRDLRLDDHLDTLIDLGIGSLKIEGRLKDLNYLKNSVSHYDKQLRELAVKRKDFRRSSSGTVVRDFDPAPESSFNRGFTPYFFDGKKRKTASFDTGKAIGEKIGTVRETGKGYFVLDSPTPLANGDGICFLNPRKELEGTQVNKTEGTRIYPNRPEGLLPGTVVYRNFDKNFSDRVGRSAPKRTLETGIELSFKTEQITVRAVREGLTICEKVYSRTFEPAQNPGKAKETAVSQFKKSGDTPFRITGIETEGDPGFMTVSALNTIRRDFLTFLSKKITETYVRRIQSPFRCPRVPEETELTYRGNVTNSLARAFYRDCGYAKIADGIEISNDSDGIEAMRMKYCLRNELGTCLKKGGKPGKLFLENNRNVFELGFDCERCEMTLTYRKNRTL